MSCELFTVDLGVQSSRLLDAFVNLAQTQKSGFIDVFPWHIAQNNNVIMIIAATNLMELRACKRRATGLTKMPTRDTNICGWLSAIVNEKSVYLAEISSRRKCDGSAQYPGIGKILFDKLVEWSNKNHKDYICLYPLSEAVEQVYIKWGLTKIEYPQNNTGKPSPSKLMFYKLKLLPSANQVKTIDPITTTDFDIISSALNESQKGFMEHLSTSKDPNAKSLFKQIIEDVQCLLSLCDEEEELESEIEKYFKETTKDVSY